MHEFQMALQLHASNGYDLHCSPWSVLHPRPLAILVQYQSQPTRLSLSVHNRAATLVHRLSLHPDSCRSRSCKSQSLSPARQDTLFQLFHLLHLLLHYHKLYIHQLRNPLCTDAQQHGIDMDHQYSTDEVLRALTVPLPRWHSWNQFLLVLLPPRLPERSGHSHLSYKHPLALC